MNTMENELQEFNPRVRTVDIGIRTQRKLKMYPLSIKDETDLLDIVKDGLEGLTALGEAESDSAEVIDFVGFLLEFVVSHLGTVLKKAIDSYSDEILDEIDNEQAMEIALIFLEQNFGGLSKKGMSLLGLEGEDRSALWRRLLQFSPNIPNSVSNIFSDIVSKKEDSQEDN